MITAACRVIHLSATLLTHGSSGIMKANKCPACGKTAMNNWSKLAGGRLDCGRCQAELRLHLPVTALLILTLLSISTFALQRLGLSSTTFFVIIGCFLIVALIFLLVPLELRNKDQ